MELKNANIVILAKNHNPSIVSKEWLTQRKIVEEKVDKFSHSPLFSLVETASLALVLDPDRLQVSLKNASLSTLELLPKLTEKYVCNLPETPYTAIGFNFLFQMASMVDSIKKLFKPDDKKFSELFSADYQVGGNISYKFDGFFAKVALLPVDDGSILADLNFHFNCKGTEDIKIALKKYDSTIKKSTDILTGLFKNV